MVIREYSHDPVIMKAWLTKQLHRNVLLTKWT